MKNKTKNYIGAGIVGTFAAISAILYTPFTDYIDYRLTEMKRQENVRVESYRMDLEMKTTLRQCRKNIELMDRLIGVLDTKKKDLEDKTEDMTAVFEEGEK